MAAVRSDADAPREQTYCDPVPRVEKRWKVDGPLVSWRCANSEIRFKVLAETHNAQGYTDPNCDAAVTKLGSLA
jgi:hypothetical protein